MITIERICSHNIEFNYFSKSKNAVPNDMELQHVQDSLIDDYSAGELFMLKIINGREYEFRGWWKIVKEN